LANWWRSVRSWPARLDRGGRGQLKEVLALGEPVALGELLASTHALILGHT
jgi:hypothetical protein